MPDQLTTPDASRCCHDHTHIRPITVRCQCGAVTFRAPAGAPVTITAQDATAADTLDRLETMVAALEITHARRHEELLVHLNGLVSILCALPSVFDLRLPFGWTLRITPTADPRHVIEKSNRIQDLIEQEYARGQER